jgi:hypothetical protein
MMKVNEDNSIATPRKKVTLIRPHFGKLDIFDFNKTQELSQL